MDWRRVLLFGLAGAAVVGLAVALGVALSGSGGGGRIGKVENVAAAMKAAGCTVRAVDASHASEHLQEQNEKVTYNTFPPTSGAHHPSPSQFGNYTTPVDPRQAVHNLEHGAVVIWYGPGTSEQDRRRITGFYDESPNGVVVTPILDPAPFVTYPKHKPLDSQIALTAWTTATNAPHKGKGVVALCPHFGDDAFRAFRDEFRGRGPERFGVDTLEPGT